MTLAKDGIEAAKIILFAMGAAIVYGLLHDQVTAHICVEYFSVAHPPIFPTESPFLLALGWGVIATWWVGLLLGVGLAAAARLGSAPPLRLADLRRPIVILMIASAITAFVAGVSGATLVATGNASIPGGWGELIPPHKHVAFTADAWAHAASYMAGGLGGVFIIGQTLWRRRRTAK